MAAVKTPEKSPAKKSCNDILFAILFLGVFAMTIAFASIYGSDVMDATKTEIAKEGYSKYKYMFHITGLIAITASFATLLWTFVMLCCGSMLIWSAVAVIIIGNIVGGIVGSKMLKEQNVKYYWWPGALCFTIALLTALYVCCIRRRIRFASANLRVACKAVLSFPCTIMIAFAFVLVQVGWALVWSIAAYGTLHHDVYDEDKSTYTKTQQFGIVSGMLLVFLWGSFILKNIVSVTTSGTIATWWFQADSPMATTSALCRALTYSFGSICFGSLIVSILETIRCIFAFLRDSAKRSGNSVAVCLLCGLECCVGCISRLTQYFNKYAYAYVGIYGHSFLSAGKHVFDLFSSKGWSTIANDSLVDTVLFVGSLVVGIVCAASGWAFVVYGESKWFEGVTHPKQVLGFTGFFIGYSISNVIFTLISGAIATIFVLFAEDPNALKTTHPEDHENLHSTWGEIYPEEYAAADGGKEVEMRSV